MDNAGVAQAKPLEAVQSITTPAGLVIEPYWVSGKYYIARNGQKIRVYCLDYAEPYCLLAGVLEDGKWARLITLTHDGNAIIDNPRCANFDIIGPWIDKPQHDWSKYPAWARWAAHDETGAAYVYSHKPYKGESKWFSNKNERYSVMAYILKVEVPPLGACPWDESLCERPEGV